VATVQQIYNQLVADSRVVVGTGDPATHERLRVRLCKLHSSHKKLFAELGADEDNLSVCATYHSGQGESTFTIAKSRKVNGLEFEIVS